MGIFFLWIWMSNEFSVWIQQNDGVNLAYQRARNVCDVTKHATPLSDKKAKMMAWIISSKLLGVFWGVYEVASTSSLSSTDIWTSLQRVSEYHFVPLSKFKNLPTHKFGKKNRKWPHGSYIGNCWEYFTAYMSLLILLVWIPHRFEHRSDKLGNTILALYKNLKVLGPPNLEKKNRKCPHRS